MPDVDKWALIRQRGGKCEICKERAGKELNHCLFHKRKGVDYLNAEENYQVVCAYCHKVTGEAHTRANKCKFWKDQCERYGEKHMLDWWDGVPMKSTKERFW